MRTSQGRRRQDKKRLNVSESDEKRLRREKERERHEKGGEETNGNARHRNTGRPFLLLPPKREIKIKRREDDICMQLGKLIPNRSTEKKGNNRDVKCPCVRVSACVCENKNDRETRKEIEQTKER